MSDRELLELAAKAAGLTLEWGGKYKLGDDEIDCTDIPYVRSGQPDEGDVHWNPLDDDGDALRLAVQLGLTITPNYHVEQQGLGIVVFTELEDSEDFCMPTRRAIVRAAAEIGRQMP